MDNYLAFMLASNRKSFKVSYHLAVRYLLQLKVKAGHYDDERGIRNGIGLDIEGTTHARY